MLINDPMGPQCESPGPQGDYCKASREPVQTRIKLAVERKRRELAALEALLKIMDKVEVDSPLEELIWELTQRRL